MMPFVASILAKVTVIMALALIGTWLARRNRAASRHVLLVAAFAVLLILPIASVVGPSIQVAVPMRAPEEIVPAVEPVGNSGPVSAPTDAGAVAAQTTPQSSWPSLTALLAAGWAVGAAVFLLPIVAGLWQMRSMRRSGLPWRDGRSLLDPLAIEARIHRPVQVLLHESVAGPMTCGVVQPAIVLPTDAQNWAEADLQRAMVHELEHVRRADWVSQCLARAACACYWFHPLVWVAWRQLILEAERACDDAVLRRSDATAYADQLVVLAQRLSTAPSRPQLAMANRHDLAARVVAVLDSRQRRGRAGALWVVLAIVASAVLVTTISPLRVVSAASASAASTATADKAAQTSADGPKFDIVSIKPCDGEPPTPPGQRSSQGGFPTSSPGRFFVECGTVERLISTAYVQNGDPLTNQAARIGDVEWLKGVPGWLRSEKFTIEAKAEGTPDRKVMMGPMLRALLEDRFKLKVHRATDQAPMYVMTVAKGGLKIQPIGEDGCTKIDRDNPPGRDEMLALGAGPKPICGSMNMMRSPGGLTRWTIGGETMQNLAGTLSTFMDRHVIDKTGITGEFNVRLEFGLDEHVPGPDKRERADPPAAPVESTAPDGPTIFMALEQQLGVKLDPTKGPHGFLVIDHVERPSPNSGPAILDTSAQTRGAAPKFEVVSIKACKPEDLPSGGRGGGAGPPSASPGRLHVDCAPLVGANGLIRQAYGTFASGRHNAYLQPDAVPVEGGPAWIRSDRYTIDAKVEGTPSMEMMRGPMLQALLEDRFQLKIRRETKEVPVYELTVAKGGSKLRPFDGRCTPVDFTKGNIPAQLEAEGSCPIALRNTRVDAPGETLGDFITFVLTLLDRPVIDKTGLTGRFDIHLDLPADDPSAAPDVTSTLAVALQQQLGLKLVPARGPGAFLVIDHVERPGK